MDYKATDAEGHWMDFKTVAGTYNQTWTASDGSYGSDVNSADGSSTHTRHDADGSTTVTSYDASTKAYDYAVTNVAGMSTAFHTMLKGDQTCSVFGNNYSFSKAVDDASVGAPASVFVTDSQGSTTGLGGSRFGDTNTSRISATTSYFNDLVGKSIGVMWGDSYYMQNGSLLTVAGDGWSTSRSSPSQNGGTVTSYGAASGITEELRKAAEQALSGTPDPVYSYITAHLRVNLSPEGNR